MVLSDAFFSGEQPDGIAFVGGGKMDKKKIKFSILQVTFWCGYGAFSGFMVAYMQSKGMSVTLIGVMLTVNTFSAFLGQFFWGMLCDKLKTNKKIYIVASILTFMVELLIFASDSWMLIIITFGILGFVQQPLAANLDTWILRTYRKTPQVYGPIRSTASIAFAIFSFFYGGMLEKNGYQLMLIFSGLFLVMGAVTAELTSDIPVEELYSQTIPKEKTGWELLAKNKEYLQVLFMLFGTGIATAPVIQLMAVIMDNVAGSVAYVGYAMFAGSLMQVPFMIFSGKLNRYSAKGRIIFAGCIYIIAILGMSFGKTPLMVLVFCAINGIGYGILLPALRELIFTIAPKELNTTAQGICDAVYTGFGSMISNILAGILVANFSVTVLLWVCSAIQIVAIIGFIIGLQYRNSQK